MRRKNLFSGSVVAFALFTIFAVFRAPLSQRVGPDGETPLEILFLGMALFVLAVVQGVQRRRRRAKTGSERTLVSKLPIGPE